MTIVIDAMLSNEEAKKKIQDTIKSLKSHSPIFRNVRLNVLRWNSNESMKNEVMGLAVLQMGSYFDALETENTKKTVDSLFENLKTFHARSKLVIVYAKEEPVCQNPKATVQAMNPFLKQKLLWIQDSQMLDGKQIQMQFIRLSTE